MAARLATQQAKSLYKRRAAQVEPFFAQFFARFGRYLNYRGRDAADAELKLLGAVHDLADCWITSAGNSPPPDQAQPAATRQPPWHCRRARRPANPSGPAGDAQPSDDQPAS